MIFQHHRDLVQKYLWLHQLVMDLVHVSEVLWVSSVVSFHYSNMLRKDLSSIKKYQHVKKRFSIQNC